MDVVFGKRAELVMAVTRLERARTKAGVNTALAEALRLACENLTILADFRFTALRGKKKDRRKARKLAMSPASDDGHAECAWIGEMLDRYDNGGWHLKEQYIALYLQLRTVFAETADKRPTGRAQLSVVSLRDTTCALAQKAKARRLRPREMQAARIVLGKVAEVALFFAGFIGLEQDFPGFLDDASPVVEVMVHGLDRLITEPEFLVDLPLPGDPAPPLAASVDSPKPDGPAEVPAIDPPDSPAKAELAVIIDLFDPPEPAGRLRRLEDLGPLEDVPDPFEPTWDKPKPPDLDEPGRGPSLPGF